MPTDRSEHETRLLSKLSERDQALAEETRALVAKAAELLHRTTATFPSGTDHTQKHTRAVEMCASMLMPDAMLDELTNDEIQLIVLGCHYHDLGMAGTVAESATPESQEKARQDHAIRIGRRLHEHKDKIGFRDDALVDALSDVCRGHRPPKEDGVASWETISQTAILGPGRSARLRVVSALVYAADELHLGQDRASRREEAFAGITDPISRKHWARHQMVAGPDLVGDYLALSIKPKTLIAESDLTGTVLKKALQAVEDSRGLLASEGISTTLRQIKIAWNRDLLWELLVITAASDMKPRPSEEIGDAAFRLYQDAAIGFESISALAAIDPPDESSLRRSLNRVVGDYEQQCHLGPSSTGSGNGLVLNYSLDAADHFFALANAADDIDTVLEGELAAHHAFELQRSEFGSKHYTESVTAVVASRYGILAKELDTLAVATLLKMSPTARTMALSGAPTPSTVSRPQQLALVAIAGASLDMLRTTDLILDANFRLALKTVTTYSEEALPAYIQLMEEMALIEGYSSDQLADATVPSDAAKGAHDESVGEDGNPVSDGEGRQITISQTLPKGTLAPMFPSLFLAARRTGAPVQFLSVDGGPLTMKEVGEEPSESVLAAFAISPGKGSHPPSVSHRADFNFDPATGALTIELLPRTEEDSLDLDGPLLTRMSTQGLLAAKALGESQPTNLNFAFYWPELRAKHWNSLLEINGVKDIEGFQQEIRSAGSVTTYAGTAPGTQEQLEQWQFAIADPSFVTFLFGKGPDTNFPFICPPDLQAAIAEGDRKEWEKLYEIYSERGLSEKKESLSVFIQLAHEGGYVYHEEYAGLHQGITLRPISTEFEEGSLMTQQDVDRAWNESDGDCIVGMSLPEDEHELLCIVREWAVDPTKPFQLNASGEAPKTPAYKSRVEMIYKPRIDRLWYAERRLVFRIRPANDEERWNIEGKYWQSVGDTKREQLIRERLRSLKDAPGDCCETQ